MIKIHVREKEKVIILDLEGNIDINSSNFVETVGWVLKNKKQDIICNFENVNLVDYIGISIIAVAYKNILNHKRRMKICNIKSHLKNLFTLVGLNRVFTYYDNEDEAISGLRDEARIYKILDKKLRRRFKRIPSHSVIEYKQKFSSRPTYFKGKALNLSALGIFLVAKKIFPVGDILTVRLNFKPKPGLIEVDTKVIWLADQQIQPLEYPGMGLEFYKIDSTIQEQIMDFVNKHIARSDS